MYSIASFFAGVGGIDLGFEQTGEFKTVYANEFDKYASETFELNFPEVTVDQRLSLIHICHGTEGSGRPYADRTG